MTELILALFLLIVLAIIQTSSPKANFSFPPVKGIITNKCRLNSHRYINKDRILINLFSKELHHLYNSDMCDKREFIVTRLNEMSEIIDLDDVFDNCEYLRPYIFNTYG